MTDDETDLNDGASAPAKKRAVKKAATAKKTPVKKAAAKPASVAPAKTAVKKTAAKKAAQKKTAASTAQRELALEPVSPASPVTVSPPVPEPATERVPRTRPQSPAPVAAIEPESAAPTPTATSVKKKAAPRKKTGPVPGTDLSETVPATPVSGQGTPIPEPASAAAESATPPAATPPPADEGDREARHRRPARRPDHPQGAPRQPSGGPESTGDRPPRGDRPPHHGERHHGPGAPHQHQHPHQNQNGPHPGQPQTGPDGRRLTKWERWKQRKEKFKQMKQQRYLEKQARLQGGENGGGSPDGAPHGSAAETDRPARPEIQLGPPEDCAGLLELTPGKGFGFLRPKERNFAALPTDPFVTPEMVRNLGLRDGLWVEAVMRRGGRGPQVVEIKSVNGREPEAYRLLPLFEELTAINPTKRYVLETQPGRYTTRLIDFIAPIGRGQRGLIVAPPRAGKTTILQHIAEAVRTNYPEVKLIVLLVDERPEEVTELARSLPGAEIMASNNDRDPRDHIRIAALAMERARRLVEAGEHVFMLLDSITRLARAFNNAIRGHGGGKGSLSGGVDARALEGARRMFASARNTREAGSLTIVGTALVETNSRADDLIFQEFKGTGNMELVLDRRIAQQYIYPAVDIFKSGTRREELLLPPHQMEKVHVIRRGLAGHKPVEAVERLIHFMERFNNNAQLLVEIKSRE